MQNRRHFLTALCAVGLAAPARTADAEARMPTISMSKDPSCGCCTAWADRMRAAGFAVEVTETTEIERVKAQLGVPRELASCHTARVEGYVIEGHVPPDVVKRLLAERPVATGLAVPGMPVGSPGMEIPGTADDAYDVVLFGPNGRAPFARYRGSRAV